MSTFLQRFLLLLLVAILQHSFLNILWPDLVAPAAIIALIVTLVFLSGFKQGGLASLLALTLYFLLGQENEIFAPFAVLIAYGTSFLARRLVIERSLQTSFVLALASAGFTLVYILLVTFWTHEVLDGIALLVSIVQTLFVFPVIFVVFRTWEKYARESAMSEFRGLRT